MSAPMTPNQPARVTGALDAARDTAQQVATAILYGDRDRAADLAIAFPSPVVLALVVADLLSFVHRTWAAASGADRDAMWAAILTDIEARRIARHQP